jgi:hypothetical protein
MNLSKLASYASHSATPGGKVMHKPEYLKIAQDWPHEYFHPSHYQSGSGSAPPPTTPEMLSLIASSHQEPAPVSFFTAGWNKVLALVIGSTSLVNQRWSFIVSHKRILHERYRILNYSILKNLKNTRPLGQ